MTAIPTHDVVDVESEWSDIASVLGTPTAPAPTLTADLSAVRASYGHRRTLRRFLIAVGAIRPDAPPPVVPPSPSTSRTEDVIARLITADAPTLTALLTATGLVTGTDRISDFATRIAAAGTTCQPADPWSVRTWVDTVGTILRGDE